MWRDFLPSFRYHYGIASRGRPRGEPAITQVHLQRHVGASRSVPMYEMQASADGEILCVATWQDQFGNLPALLHHGRCTTTTNPKRSSHDREEETNRLLF
jgi:hypothetical protein